jgi:hypothetical protein
VAPTGRAPCRDGGRGGGTPGTPTMARNQQKWEVTRNQPHTQASRPPKLRELISVVQLLSLWCAMMTADRSNSTSAT